MRHAKGLSFFLVGAILGISAAHANPGVTYHGRLLKPTGAPVAAPSVQFRIQIRTPPPTNCLLFEEIQVKDLSESLGVFSVSLNDGSAVSPNAEPFTLDRVFQNRGRFQFTSGKCGGTSSDYLPGPTDGRVIAVSFNDGSFSGWEPLPHQDINFVPMAFESVTVGGYRGSDLFRVENASGAPQPMAAWSPAAYSALTGLVGSVTSSGNAVTGISGTASGFTGSLAGDVTGTQSATSVVKIQGYPISTSAPTSGQVLMWNSAASIWEPSTVSGGGGGGGGSVAWTDITGKPATYSPGGNAGGDLTGIYPSPTIAANAVTATKIVDGAIAPSKLAAGTAAGQVMRFNGASWATTKLQYTDLTNNGSGGGSPWPTSTCGAGQAIIWSSAVDGFICQTLSVSSSNIADLGVNKIISGTGLYLTYQPNGVSCTAGQILKWTAANRWECASESGVGTESDPTVQAFAKNAPSSDFATTGNTLSLVTVPVSKGGTGATTAQAALNNLLPSQGTHAGKVLQTDGSNVSWVTPAAGGGGGSGTVTSVGLSLPSLFTVTNSPVTTTGTLTATLASQTQSTVLAAPLAGNGVPSFRSLQINDIKSSGGGNFLTGTACTANQALVYTSANDTLTCQTIAGTTPAGSAGGDLSGTYPNPTIAALTVNKITSGTGLYLTYQPNGVACTAGQVLKWNNSRWECGTDDVGSGGGATGTVTNVTGTAPITVTNGTTTPALSIATGGITSSHIADGTVAGVDLAAGAAVANLGYTPANRAGDTFTGNISAPGVLISGAYGTNGFVTGNGDNATYATHNIKLNLWNGLGIATYDGTVNGFYDSRAGIWDVKGGYRVSGSPVWTQASLTNLNQLTNGPGYISGINSSMVTTALGFTPLSNSSASGQGIAYTNAGGPQVMGVGNGASMISFHRPGQYGVNFGLDTDNVLKVGGWSMGAVARTIWHSGNFDPGSKVNLNSWSGSSYIGTDGRHFGVNFIDSNDNNFYLDPNAHSEIGRIRTNSNWDGYQGGLMLHGNAPTITFQDTDTSIRWMIHNPDDAMRIYRANTAGGTDWDQKVIIANDGNIWSKAYGGWLTDRVNQDLRAGANPNFGNIWLGYLGVWLSDRLNQDVRNGAGPTFGTLTMNDGFRRPDNGGVLNIRGGVDDGGGARIELGGAGSGIPGKVYITSRGPSGTNADVVFRRFDGSNFANLGWFKGNGDLVVVGSGTTCTVGNGTAGTACSSDERLKDEIQPIGSALEKILSIRGVTFVWNENARAPGAPGMGVIAQDVEKIFPNSVTYDDNGYRQVDYSSLVAPLIESARELHETDQGMKREIASLKEENAELKTRLRKMEEQLQQLLRNSPK